MELRRRRGDVADDARDSSAEVSVVGTIGGDSFAAVSHSLRRPTSDGFDDGGFTPSSSEAADAVVGAAVRGGSLLMVLALIQRASTFVLNVLLHRAMLSADSGDDDGLGSKTEKGATSALEEYGAAAITLELISSTALFLAREPFRVALARSRAPAETRGGEGGGEGAGEGRGREEKQQQQQRRRFVNTAWLSAPVGLAFAGVVKLAYPWAIRNDSFHGVEENRQAASLVCLAAALELMCEPLALIFQYRLLVDVRVRAEAAAVLVLGVSRYLLVTRAGTGILSFGYAQLLHSATLATAYILFAARDVARKTPAPRTKGMPNALESSEGLERHVASGAPGSSLSSPSSVVTPAAAATTATPTTHSTAATAATPPPAANDRGGFSSIWGWLPSRPSRHGDGSTAEGWVDYGHLRLAWALAGQSVLKHVLTEGDKIVLARATASDEVGSSSLREQGVYAIASGYGSLAARLLFQPVEEAARLMFSKLGAEGMGADAVETTVGAKLAAGKMDAAPGQGAGQGQDIITDNGKDADSNNDTDVDINKNRYFGGGGADVGRETRARMAALLATLLKLVLTAGLVFVCFGFHYTETLLRLLLAGKRGGGGGGEGAGASAVTEVSRVTEVSQVLSWYCVYVLFLAANGMCEAFSSAVARGSQLTGMGAGLVASFTVFWALVGPLTSRFGTPGLVMANASGMACRVVCSAAFIRRFFLHETPTVGTLRHRRNRQHRSRSSNGAPHVTVATAVTSATAPRNDGRAAEKNLWKQVLSGALPHPCVAVAMVASSAVAHAASPSGSGGDGVDWDATAAARHVAIGAVCFAATALVFARYEGVFVGEMRALWAARRRGGGAAGGDPGAVKPPDLASSMAVGRRDKTD